MLVDLSAIRDAAAKRESNHWLMANAANPANLANQKPESPDELAKLATLAGLAISHGLETLPPPDPGMARLLALADIYCTAIQASDKARQDWRADIEATPAQDRGGLAAYLRDGLSKLVPPVAPKPAPPAVVSPAATPSPAKPLLPKFSVHQSWNVADRAYQAHHWNCTTCKAAARSGGSSQRCATGQHLYATYEQDFDEAAKEST